MRMRMIQVGVFFNGQTPEMRKLVEKPLDKRPADFHDQLFNSMKRISPSLERVVRHLRSKFHTRVEYRFSNKAGCRCGCSPGFRLFVPETVATVKMRKHIRGDIWFWGKDDGSVKCRYPRQSDLILKVTK